MEFVFETCNDHAAMTAMSRVLRKLYRRTSSILIRLACFAFAVFGIYKIVTGGSGEVGFSSVFVYLSLLFMLLVAVWEDGINGVMALQRIPQSSRETVVRFDDDRYVIETDMEVTSWQYQRINTLAECKYYFVFVFNKNHAQIFDKDTLNGGSEEEFRDFIEKKTGKKFQPV